MTDDDDDDDDDIRPVDCDLQRVFNAIRSLIASMYCFTVHIGSGYSSVVLQVN